MDHNLEYGKWSLMVNGEMKPWPIDNYLETTITIDLNWGIDTKIYESVPLTFNVSDVINGNSVEGVIVDREHHLIVCDIPIRKREKKLKVIVDWSNLKNSIKNDLRVVVNGKNIKIEDGCISLEGEDIISPLICYYNGEKCDISEEDGMNIIRVNLPYNKKQSNLFRWLKNSRFKYLYTIVIFIIGLIVGVGYGLVRPKIVVRTVTAYKEVEIRDTIYVSQTLKDAQLYLQNNQTWKRYEMERIPELKGLFDALAQYRFDIVSKQLDNENFRNIEKVDLLLHEIKFLKHHCDIDEIESLHSLRKKFYKYYDDQIPYHQYIRELRECRIRINKIKRSE